MPKVSWCKPKVNYLAAMLKAAKKERNMTDDQIGKLVGCSGSCVRDHMNKPADKWTIGRLMLFCDALGIPYYDALMAAIQK